MQPAACPSELFMTDTPHKPKSSFRTYFHVAMFVLICSGGAIASRYAMKRFTDRTYRARFETEIELVRDRGEPLDGEELNAYYAIPPGELDVTPEYTEALSPLTKSASAKKSALEQLQKNFPLGAPVMPPHRPHKWDRLEEAERLLQPFDSILISLDQAASRPGFARYPVDFQLGLMALLPNTLAISQMRSPFHVRVLCQYHGGDFEGATQTIITMMRTAETLHFEPIHASQMVRIATNFQAYRLITYLAADSEYPIEHLQRIQEEISRQEFESALPRTSIGERAATYVSLTRITDELMHLEYGVKQGFVPIETLPADCFFLLDWLAAKVEDSQLPLMDAVRAEGERERKIDRIIEKHLARNPPKEFCAAIHRRFDESASLFLNAETSRRAMIAFCAVERFRRREPGLPEDLDELVPAYLPGIPLDPASDAPLRYHHLAGKFVVYGLGVDEQDNGGQVSYWTSSQTTDVGIASFGYQESEAEEPIPRPR